MLKSSLPDSKVKKPVNGVHRSEQEVSELRHELSQVQDELVMAHEQMQEVQAQLAQAQDREQRALADYQNLLRRTDSDRTKLARLAARGLVEDLLQPLEHLSLAADHLQDPGLSMAVKQFWQRLEEHGLKEIEVMGKEFDVNSMEAVESDASGGDDKNAGKVVKIVRRGYTLNGEILQHAKVVLG